MTFKISIECLVLVQGHNLGFLSLTESVDENSVTCLLQNLLDEVVVVLLLLHVVVF